MYWAYIKAMGLKTVSIGVIFVLLSTGLDLTSSIWLSKWTGDKVFLNDSSESNPQKQSAMEMYLIGMSAIGVGQGRYLV